MISVVSLSIEAIFLLIAFYILTHFFIDQVSNLHHPACCMVIQGDYNNEQFKWLLPSATLFIFTQSCSTK